MQFAAATAALSAAAGIATFVSRLPGHARLEYPMFRRLFAFTDDRGALLELGLVLLVWALPAVRRAGVRLAGALGEHPHRAALATFAVLAAGARFAYDAAPLAMDEYAQLCQSYAFAHGHRSWFLAADLLDRTLPRGFRDYFFAVDVATGEVASVYWPGFAALLAPFAWAGVPWLLNPALTAASVLLIHALGVRILGSRVAAGWAVLLALASPAFTVNGISFYSMNAHLTANLAFAWLLLDGRTSRALAAGLIGGFALVLHNPVPHLLFALPWIAWLGADRRRWAALFALGAGYVPIGLVVGVGWPLFLGSIGAHGAAAVAAPLAPASLGMLIADKLHGAFEMPDAALVSVRIMATWKLWIWSAPGLLVLAAAGLIRAGPPLRLFAASAALTYLAYWFVPADQGHGWGYRYMQSAWGALPLLGAAFIASRAGPGTAGDAWREWVGGLAAASLVCATSFWFWQVHAIISVHLAQRIPTPPAGRWVVFVSYHRGMYTWDMIQNRPGDTQTLTMMSFGSAADARLMALHFPAARRTEQDARGSLWSLAGDAAAQSPAAAASTSSADSPAKNGPGGSIPKSE